MEDNREALLKLDAHERECAQRMKNIQFQLDTVDKRLDQIGRAHVWTPVTATDRMPSSAWKKKNKNNKKNNKKSSSQGLFVGIELEYAYVVSTTV